MPQYIVTLIGDMGWAPISITTKLSCIRFWQRLSNMSHDRLNYKIFTESCRLAENGKKNWASSMKVYLNYLNSHLGFRPSITDKHFLQYYQDMATKLYKSEWRQQVNHIRDNSESGGRLNIYRNIKSDLVTESYVANEWSVSVRRVLAGLRAGCLPLGVETGRYTGIPYYQRTCRLCDLGEVEDQHHFLIISPTLKDLRLQLFNYCYFLSQTFFELPMASKTHFILNNYNSLIAKSLYRMGIQRQLLLFSH